MVWKFVGTLILLCLLLSVLTYLIKSFFFKKEKGHLKEIENLINERLDYSFNKIHHGDRMLAEVLKETINSNQNDIKKTTEIISKKLLEIKFYEYIKDKNGKELINLKKEYKKQIVSVELLNVEFSKAFSHSLTIYAILLAAISIPINIFIDWVPLINKNEIIGDGISIIFIVILILVAYILISIIMYMIKNNHHIQYGNLIEMFNKTMESFILDIEQRLYELEHGIRDNEK